MTRFYKAWLRLPRPADPSVLYRPTKAFGLNLKSLRLMLRHLQTVKWHIIKSSADVATRLSFDNRLQRDAAGHRGTGRKTTPCLELEKLEYDLHLRILVGNAQSGRQGLGMPIKGSGVRWNRVPSAAIARQQLSALIKQHELDRVEAVKQNYQIQNAWLRWTSMRMQGDLQWNKILYRYSEHLLQFVLKAQLNVLPSLDNLRRWNITSGGTCSLCRNPFSTLLHVFTNCKSVLGEEKNGHVPEKRY